MSKRHVWMAAAFLSMAAAAFAQVYKWVDEDGVTHFSSEPPTEAACEEVEIDAPPTEVEIEEAERRLEAMTEAVEGWKAEHAAEREALAAERAAASPALDERARACVQAEWNLDQLRQAMPAYYANDGYIYCGSSGRLTSLHNLWYTGPRRWIDDAERDDEIRHWQEMAAMQCEGLDRKALAAQRARWQQKLLCERLRYEYGRGEEDGGSVSDQVTEWREFIARHCPPED